MRMRVCGGSMQGPARVQCAHACTALRTHLDVCMVRLDLCVWLYGVDDRGGGAGLAGAHVVLPKQELAVKVAGLDGVQVDLGGGSGGWVLGSLGGLCHV